VHSCILGAYVEWVQRTSMPRLLSRLDHHEESVLLRSATFAVWRVEATSAKYLCVSAAASTARLAACHPCMP
jgi:hypothetical protein